MAETLERGWWTATVTAPFRLIGKSFAERSAARRTRTQQQQQWLLDWKARRIHDGIIDGDPLVTKALAAAALFEPIANDPEHPARASALYNRGRYLHQAADEAWADGRPPAEVERYRSSAIDCFETARAITRGINAPDTPYTHPLAEAKREGASATFTLFWLRMERGETELARECALDYAERKPGEGNDIARLHEALESVSMNGPGSAGHYLNKRPVSGRAWLPDGIDAADVPRLCLAIVGDVGAEQVSMTVARWPVLDSDDRMRSFAADSDWKHLTLSRDDFQSLSGMRVGRGDAFALTLNGPFPTYETAHPGGAWDPVHDFGEFFTWKPVSVGRELRAHQLATVRRGMAELGKAGQTLD